MKRKERDAVAHQRGKNSTFAKTLFYDFKNPFLNYPNFRVFYCN